MQATAIVYAALQLSLLVQWSTDSPKPISASIPSAALSLVAALTICHLSFTEHRRSIRPSTLLNFYLLITLVLDAVQARTLFLLQDAAAIASVYTAAISIKLLLLILEAQSKASILRPSYRSLSPEETAGILNRLFLWWINSVFVTGYRKLLTGDDLPRLDAELSSEHMRKELQRAWDGRCKQAVVRCR
jgi:ATP-binding cassette subfamily C (CFTR/MRP) protein 1